MKNKDKFIEALNTLFYSWGSDTPAEVVWGGNELLKWYEAEYNVKLGVEFDEDIENSCNFKAVIKAIKNK